MISTNSHFGFTTSNCLRRAVKHIEFCAFNVEFNVIDTRQIFSRNGSIQVNELRRQVAVQISTRCCAFFKIGFFAFSIAQAEVF